MFIKKFSQKSEIAPFFCSSSWLQLTRCRSQTANSNNNKAFLTHHLKTIFHRNVLLGSRVSERCGKWMFANKFPKWKFPPSTFSFRHLSTLFNSSLSLQWTELGVREWETMICSIITLHSDINVSQFELNFSLSVFLFFHTKRNKFQFRNLLLPPAKSDSWCSKGRGGNWKVRQRITP